MRARRIENEWKLLQDLETRNREVLTDIRRGIGDAGEFFQFKLNQTTGPVKGASGIRYMDSHQIEFRFPRFFPTAPIEATLQVPVFHPNVDPDTGFVCLWTRTSLTDNVVEAATRIQRIIAGDLINFTADHVMQPEAADWYKQIGRTAFCFLPLVWPESITPLLPAPNESCAPRRQRLFRDLESE